MRKEDLIKLAEELNGLTDLKGREDDLRFLKKEYIRLSNRDEETYFEKMLTDKFNKAYESLASKVPELNRSSLDDKKALISKAKELVAKGDNLKSLTRDIEALFSDFKHLPKCSKEQDDELFAEFKQIREEANKKVSEYYNGLRIDLDNKVKAKEDIIAKAKEILKMENIKNATAEMDKLMDAWKTVGFSGKEHDEELWNNFKEVRNEFQAKRKAHFENMKVVIEERATKKAELIKKVKYITSEAYFTPEEIKQIKDIEKEFRNLGFAGKDKDQELWDEMQAAIRKYFEEMKFYK